MKPKNKGRLLQTLNGISVLLSPRSLGDVIDDVVPIWVEDTRCWEWALLTDIHTDTGKGPLKFNYQICDPRFGL